MRSPSQVDSVLPADLRDSVALEIAHSVPEVQAVFVVFGENRTFHVWSVVPEYDRAIFRTIYAKEKQIINRFDDVEFDFNILPSHGRDPETLISDPQVQLAFIRK
jgi:hypothetical protein